VYYAVLGLPLLGLAILGSSGAIVAPLINLPVAIFLCGAVRILVGLLDHRLLVRTLKPIEEFELETSEEDSSSLSDRSPVGAPQSGELELGEHGIEL
jgi:hypothetical protein